jgi:hypothetical protein
MSLGHGASIVRDGLILHLDAANIKSYPGANTTWYDISGNDNNGTLVNDVGYNSDNNGYLSFDGVNDYVNVAGDYHLISELTFDCWFKPTNTIAGGANQVGRIWGKGADLECRFDGGGTAVAGRLSCDLGGNNSLTSVNAVWSNTVWYNLVIVMLSGSSRMYVQSELDATGTRGSIAAQTATFQIGKSASNLGSPFPGSISSFKIYNRALSDAEIKRNFEATRGRYGI